VSTTSHDSIHLEARLKSFWLGVISAAVVFVMLLKFLSGAPDNASFMESINPVAVVNGLAFAFGFGAGFPTPLALITAVFVIVSIPTATFLLVRRLTRRFDRRARA
jgi:hypothetical protein